MRKTLKRSVCLILSLLLVALAAIAAAEEKDEVQTWLANMYFTGMGVEQSKDRAMELYRLAAELGSEEARQQLEIYDK